MGKKGKKSKSKESESNERNKSQSNKSSICLSMIVKNEAHVIVKTLTQLIEVFNITYIVICDTGSSDNTIEIINQFIENNSKGIKGEVHQHKWEDFSHNRNLALDISREKADYSLIFDADDIVHGDLKLSDKLEYDMYNFKMDKVLNYKRPLLINNNKKFKWYGVLHECIKNLENITIFNVTGDYYIESGHTGDRSKNKHKFLDDGKVFENIIQKFEKEGIDSLGENKFLYSRYLYYCAQSYRDCIETIDSIFKTKASHYYKKVLESDGWIEEKYVSCYELYHIENDINYLIKSFSYNPNKRIECVCKLMAHCIGNKTHHFVKMLYYEHKDYQKRDYINNLFIKTMYYSGYFEYLYSLSAYYCEDYEEGLTCCKYCIEKDFNVETCDKNLKLYNDKIYEKNNQK